ncbi:protein NETWORKED 2D isoform X2 [Oryza sativa Japonica Group]|uniref:Kinase interacting protein 1 n=2 Tax=Oryza sativa subsp. japonica TaxID=39947 RepID=B9FV26_ORYSJ|nr:protein NETWORKED 2A isoform X2 [Oryza sativa Japonica Group]EEE67883.1 hypothetical protein OsJ_25709 [Oryza sativa Japonica Group]KAF2924702.1 hypothetical protein DAI22_07g285600 [Oryza sativa Japonica Group]KAF2924703.1 hypothetical protein DAI22_07g285600 [Oryza sativa Japonica Group]BAC84068.1 putative kinase interacting protein 1 [Oryza sativa Japonica Group]BAF22659.1 Os07g0695400 [Oryza sativa Japonica Group]|eukprot:NP_001060745.1 Os07g0695400 [Oryza sativa Japonica Group]
MLQRAASNAYSWWWASHIRTTQSKWLDANLQEMETRVKIMLKLLGEEADTFGKRAEMYYRRRPEVINHVEEVYRAYRALVERYDHLSKELHKANHTIATACPQHDVSLLQEQDDAEFTPIRIQESTTTVQEVLNPKGHARPCAPHFTKQNAQQEIDTLQKAILVLQTEKEFVKSSYETGITKYREIEKQIADMQDQVCHIQNEFDAHASIEDDEARALMTITALRSCQGTVANLVKIFEELVRVAAGESEKVNYLRQKLYAMNYIIDPSKGEVGTTNIAVKNRVYPNTQEILELQPIYEKIEKFFELNSESVVQEMAERVDELVDKVMNLELKFPKQSAQIKQLKEDNDSLKDRLDDLQDEIALRDDPSDLSEQLKLAEDELNRVKALERSVIEEEVLVSTVFSEVVSCITNISKAFGSIDPEDMTSLSAAVENDGEITSDDISTSLPEEEFRGTEEATTDDNLGRDRCRKEDASGVEGHDSLDGTDGIDDCKNGNEENFQSENRLIQEDLMDKRSIQASNNIDRIVIPGKENGFNNACEGKIDCSPSGNTKKYRDIGNDVIDNSVQGESLKGEHPPTVISQTHLPHSECLDTLTNKSDSDEKGSSVVVTVNSFGGSKRIQGLRIGGDENSMSGNSLIQEELRDDKSLKTPGYVNLVGSTNQHSLSDGSTTEEISLPKVSNSCFSDADMRLELCHTEEAISVEEWPKQDGQLIAPETMKSLNGGSKVDSSEKGGRTSLEHMNSIQDLKTSELVDAHSSRVYQQVPKVTTKSNNIASCIPHGELEMRSSDGREHTRQASTLSKPGSMSLRVNSSLVAERDAPSWQEFLLDGIEGREALLLDDYTLILRNYKETKRRLAELEKKNEQHPKETKTVIRELRNANSMKYVEIQSLRDLLDPSEDISSTHSKMGFNRSNHPLDTEISVLEGIDVRHTGVRKNTSPFEVKFRSEIDALVEENLQFLVRFSMACHRMQDFDSKYQELQKGMGDFEVKKTGEPDAAAESDPAEKKLRELRTELDVWFEQNALLDQDLQLKTMSLCRLQEEIAEALRASAETDGGRFTPYEAAKFQGEVLNMQQSSGKIERELQSALKRMRELEGKVNDGLQKLRESFDLSCRRSSLVEEESSSTSYHSQFKHFPTRTRVPLRNFLFGTKPKKKSIFACINPTLQKQFSDL